MRLMICGVLLFAAAGCGAPDSGAIFHPSLVDHSGSGGATVTLAEGAGGAPVVAAGGSTESGGAPVAEQAGGSSGAGGLPANYQKLLDCVQSDPDTGVIDCSAECAASGYINAGTMLGDSEKIPRDCTDSTLDCGGGWLLLFGGPYPCMTGGKPTQIYGYSAEECVPITLNPRQWHRCCCEWVAS